MLRTVMHICGRFPKPPSTARRFMSPNLCFASDGLLSRIYVAALADYQFVVNQAFKIIFVQRWIVFRSYLHCFRRLALFLMLGSKVHLIQDGAFAGSQEIMYRIATELLSCESSPRGRKICHIWKGVWSCYVQQELGVLEVSCATMIPILSSCLSQFAGLVCTGEARDVVAKF